MHTSVDNFGKFGYSNHKQLAQNTMSIYSNIDDGHGEGARPHNNNGGVRCETKQRNIF